MNKLTVLNSLQLSGDRHRRLVPWVIALTLTLGACATQQGPGDGQLAQPQALSRPDGAVRGDTQNPEVAKLWAAAERARAEDKPVVALELLYEALELAPEDSLLWSRAAEIKLDRMEPVLAENYAMKSNAFAGGQAPLLYRNWLIIEHARRMRGDLLGVRGASQQVRQYRYQ